MCLGRALEQNSPRKDFDYKRLVMVSGKTLGMVIDERNANRRRRVIRPRSELLVEGE